jgi:hypothetical protein
MRENLFISTLAKDLLQMLALYLLARMTEPFLVPFVGELVALLRINIGN